MSDPQRGLARSVTLDVLLRAKKTQKNADWLTVLPSITAKDFSQSNRRWAHERNMLKEVYGGSTYDAVIDATRSSDRLGKYRDLRPYDMRVSRRGTWSKSGQQQNLMVHEAVGKLLDKLAEQEPLEQVLPRLRYKHATTVPINRYKTTLSGLVAGVFKGSLHAALKDTIDNVERFAQYRDFMPYDMAAAPRGTWQLPNGKMNYPLARCATRELLGVIMQKEGCSLSDAKDCCIADDFREVQINRYGTTLTSMLSIVYHSSPKAALADVGRGRRVRVPRVLDR